MEAAWTSETLVS